VFFFKLVPVSEIVPVFFLKTGTGTRGRTGTNVCFDLIGVLKKFFFISVGVLSLLWLVHAFFFKPVPVSEGVPVPIFKLP
jgi:hypothetical protein